jgi:major membrane immunogen (membrane-anchored lipoprotein)
MKKILLVFIVMILAAFSAIMPYKDGTYNGISRSVYTEEPFFGFTKIFIENEKIVKVQFYVRDSLKHELFDEKYERYFAGNAEYIQQCRNDLKGIQSYPDSLIKYQDIDKVDGISGATWSYNIFKASAREALCNAEKVK